MSGTSLGKSEAKRDTGKALLIHCEDLGRDIWVPHSVIHSDSEVYDADNNSTGELVVADWFAEKERLA